MPRKQTIIALIALALGAGVFLHTLLYSDSWKHRARARADLEALEAENAATEERVLQLRGQVEAIRSRPEAQERAIRHELGYVRPGEIVLELGAAQP